MRAGICGGTGKSEVGTGMVFTSESKPSGTCVVLFRFLGDGFEESFPFFPFSCVFLAFGCDLDLLAGSKESSSSDEDSSMTSSCTATCFPFTRERARERILARSAISIIPKSPISTPLSETFWDTSVASSVMAVGGKDRDDDGTGGAGSGGGGIGLRKETDVLADEGTTLEESPVDDMRVAGSLRLTGRGFGLDFGAGWTDDEIDIELIVLAALRDDCAV